MRANPKLLQRREQALGPVLPARRLRHDVRARPRRPAFHKALGIDPTEYDYKVFRITSEISRQVFPLTLDIDNPRFHAGLERLRVLADRSPRREAQGGLVGKLKRARPGRAARRVTFARLYLLPAKDNALPADIRLQPAW